MNVKGKDIIYILVLILIGCFFIFYNWNIIPPVIHFDQINPFIVEELKNSRELTPNLRTNIFNWVNLITPLNSFLEYFRYHKNLDGVDFIVRLPAMLLFLFSIPVWYLILKELRIKSQIPFWIIVLTSPLFIVYSKFVPTVAGFLLYISLSLLFLLKSTNKEISNKKFILNILLAIFFSIFASFTHVISIALSAILFTYFLLVYQGNNFALRFKKLNRGLIGFLSYYIFIVVSISLICISGYLSIKSGNETIYNRSGYTIVTKPLDELAQTVGKRIMVSLDPRYLVMGTNQFIKPSDSTLFQEFLNHDQSIWLTQLVGPFGLITLMMIGYLLSDKKEFKLANSLIFILFTSYLLISAVSNYDNPSPTRTFVSLFFIPIAISIFFNQQKESWKKTLILLTIITSSIYSLYIVYSPNYYLRESGKFETGIQQISQDILNDNNIGFTTILVNSDTYSQSRYFQIYLSTNIANKISEYSNSETLSLYTPKSFENVYVVTLNSNELSVLKEKGYSEVKKYGRYYFTKKISQNKNFTAFNTTNYVDFGNRIERKEESDTYRYTFPTLQLLNSNVPYLLNEQLLTNNIEFIKDLNFRTDRSVEFNQDFETLIILSGSKNPNFVHIDNTQSEIYQLNFIYDGKDQMNISFYDEFSKLYLPFQKRNVGNKYSYIFYSPKNHHVIINFSFINKQKQSYKLDEFSLGYSKNNLSNSHKEIIELTNNKNCNVKYIASSNIYSDNLKLYIDGTYIDTKPKLANEINPIWELPDDTCLTNNSRVETKYKW